MLGFQTLSRLHEIPVVRSSTDKIQDVYAKAKDTTALIRVPCNVVETVADKSLRLAFTVANPIIKPFSGQVRVIDDYAAEKLRQIETKYPVINTPMEDVVNSFNEKTEPVRHVVNSVKDTTTSTIQHGKETVSNVAAATVNKASNVADSVFSFCESHVPGIQRLQNGRNQNSGRRLFIHAFSLFNSIFQSVQTTFIWIRMLLVFSLLKTKQINDLILNKIPRKSMLKERSQRILIRIGTFLEYLIEHIKPDDRTLDQLRTKQQTRLNPQPYYYTNRGNQKPEQTNSTYRSVFNEATRSNIDSITLSDKERLYARLGDNHSTQPTYFVDNNKNDETSNFHNEYRSADLERLRNRLRNDEVTDFDNQESTNVDDGESNIEQPDSVDTQDNEDDE